MNERPNTVPEELAIMGRCLLANGWVMAGAGTYVLPGQSMRLRLNMQYAHREATVSVSTWDGERTHLRRSLAYYRGEHPLEFAKTHLKASSKFLNIFEVFADKPLSNG